MNRVTLVYLVTIVATGAILWETLRFGASLEPAADLSGEWVIEPGGGSSQSLGHWMRVDQSGRFFQLHFESGRVLNLKAAAAPTAAERSASAGSAPTTLHLSGDGWALAARLEPGPGEQQDDASATRPAAPAEEPGRHGAAGESLQVLISRPEVGAFVAHRAGHAGVLHAS